MDEARRGEKGYKKNEKKERKKGKRRKDLYKTYRKEEVKINLSDKYIIEEKC